MPPKDDEVVAWNEWRGSARGFAVRALERLRSISTPCWPLAGRTPREARHDRTRTRPGRLLRRPHHRHDHGRGGRASWLRRALGARSAARPGQAQVELPRHVRRLASSGAAGRARSAAHAGGFAVAPSGVRPKPVQTPRPPVLLAAYTPAGLVRAGTRADGWTPAGLDLATTAAMWPVVTGAATEAGVWGQTLRARNAPPAAFLADV
ncbi:MAG: LLM class flavin-dependent oxidoreductase [Acidimicrobiales bacterium]|nr:LLM class flavin-dependent oxidoreductase [Acidimicrobiales bacterium]